MHPTLPAAATRLPQGEDAVKWPLGHQIAPNSSSGRVTSASASIPDARRPSVISRRLSTPTSSSWAAGLPLSGAVPDRNTEFATTHNSAMVARPSVPILSHRLSPPPNPETPLDANNRVIGPLEDAATAFYTTQPRQEKQRDVKNLRERIQHAQPKEYTLMLIRDPPYPLWSELENMARPVRKQSSSTTAIGINRTSTKGTDARDELINMVKRRKTTEESKPASVVAMAESRNPFRRKQVVMDVPLDEDPIDSYGPSSPEQSAEKGGGGTLKPISKLVVPTLPETQGVYRLSKLQDDSSSSVNAFANWTSQPKQADVKVQTKSDASNTRSTQAKGSQETSPSRAPAIGGGPKSNRSKTGPAAFKLDSWLVKK